MADETLRIYAQVMGMVAEQPQEGVRALELALQFLLREFPHLERTSPLPKIPTKRTQAPRQSKLIEASSLYLTPQAEPDPSDAEKSPPGKTEKPQKQPVDPAHLLDVIFNNSPEGITTAQIIQQYPEYHGWSARGLGKVITKMDEVSKKNLHGNGVAIWVIN